MRSILWRVMAIILLILMIAIVDGCSTMENLLNRMAGNLNIELQEEQNQNDLQKESTEQKEQTAIQEDGTAD